MPKSGEDAIPDPESWGVSAGDARELLRHQMCPICGRGPWKSPLNHVALKHGIDKFTMRDICGLKVKESVADADLSEASRQRAAAQDKTALHEAHKQGHGKYRVTRAGAKGKADGTANLDEDMIINWINVGDTTHVCYATIMNRFKCVVFNEIVE